MIKKNTGVGQDIGIHKTPAENLTENKVKNQNPEEIFSNQTTNNKPYESDFENIDNIYELVCEEDVPIAHEEVIPETKPDTQFVNGEIDDFKQGATGDCWCLSAINSLGSCETGKEIIKNAININEDGSYSVNFKGANTSYIITQEEMDAARKGRKYSSGDDDVLLLELATEKVLSDIRDENITLPDDAPKVIDKYDTDGTGTTPLRGGWPRDLLYLLTGQNANKTSTAYGEDKFFKAIDDMVKTLSENPNTWVTVAFRPEQNPNTGEAIKTSTGRPGIMDIDGNVTMATDNNYPHAWSVTKSDGKTVTLVNPWDSSKEITVTVDALKQYVYDVEYLEFPKPQTQEPAPDAVLWADTVTHA